MPVNNGSPDVFFFEAFEEEERLLRSLMPGPVSASFTSDTIQEHLTQEPPARVISVRTQSEIPVSWTGGLDGILTRSTGYDHLIAYIARSGFQGQCGYLPRYCSRAVAEQAMLLWTALLRKLPQQQERMRTFSRDGLTGRECEGRHLFVVGVGNIGSEIVKIGTGLGMSVTGHDIVHRFPWVDYRDLVSGLKQADIIVCAMNLTAENHGYFSAEVLRKAKKGALFINISRGELSPLEDLAPLLESEHLGGAALDVYPDEGNLATLLRNDGAAASLEGSAYAWLQGLPNVILTPHNAFNTEEALRRKAEDSLKQIDHFLAGGTFFWNVPVGDDSQKRG